MLQFFALCSIYFKTSGLLSWKQNPKEAPKSEPRGSKHVVQNAKNRNRYGFVFGGERHNSFVHNSISVKIKITLFYNAPKIRKTKGILKWTLTLVPVINLSNIHRNNTHSIYFIEGFPAFLWCWNCGHGLNGSFKP